MRILHINKYYFLKGGAERYVLELMKLQEEKGHQVAIFAMEHPKNLPTKWSKYFVSNVTTDFRTLPQGLAMTNRWYQKLRTAARMFYSFEARRKLSRLLDEFKPDVVHVHNYHHQLSASVLAELKKRKLPVVATIHDFHLISPSYNLFCNGKIFQDTKPNKFWKIIPARGAQHSYTASILEALEMYWLTAWGIMFSAVTRYVAPSLFVKQKCIEYGVSGKTISVVAHPIFTGNTPVLPERKSDTRQTGVEGRSVSSPFDSAQGRTISKLRFIYVGRLDAIKGIDVLLRAFKPLADTAELHIVGSGPEEARLKKLASELKIKSTGIASSIAPRNDALRQAQGDNGTGVTWHGHQTGEALTSLLQSANVLVLPSLVYETFGLVVLEAATLGVPSIVSNLGGLPELVSEKQTGLITPAGDVEKLSQALRWCEENPELVKTMGKNARRSSERFAPKYHLEQLEKVYEEARRVVAQ